ncbi:jg538 [Pararge aegeria aegeria]|uniref:Jg538 protein n=1 Tax=Pararge aegeria aegeria TaxID=348720 RepID=A0A8S4R272_9NEOP|nr:jg538 [Pararge aegeria aegeria]
MAFIRLSKGTFYVITGIMFSSRALFDIRPVRPIIMGTFIGERDKFYKMAPPMLNRRVDVLEEQLKLKNALDEHKPLEQVNADLSREQDESEVELGADRQTSILKQGTL